MKALAIIADNRTLIIAEAFNLYLAIGIILIVGLIAEAVLA